MLMVDCQIEDTALKFLDHLVLFFSELRLAFLLDLFSDLCFNALCYILLVLNVFELVRLLFLRCKTFYYLMGCSIFLLVTIAQRLNLVFKLLKQSFNVAINFLRLLLRQSKVVS